MDPVSTVASVLTIIEAAGSSCRFVHKFLHDVAEAPVEIQAQNVRLESLDRTFTALLAMYSSVPQDTPVDIPLIERIHEFLGEIKTVRHTIGADRVWASLGRRQRLKAICKWLASDHQLQKFFRSLEQWNTIFSQLMLTTQMKLLLDIKEQTKSLMLAQTQSSGVRQISLEAWPQIASTTPTVEPLTRHQATRSGQGLSHSSKRLSRYLATISEPVGYKMKGQYEITSNTLGLRLRGGSTIVRHWSEDGQESYVMLPVSEGYSLCFTFRFWHRRIHMTVHVLYEWSSLPKLSVRSMLHVSGIIPRNGRYWSAARFGDLELMRKVLGSGQHRISDTTAHGDTSLHIATRYQNNEAVLFLLENGANIDATNDRGQTPLHLALINCKDAELPEILLSRGADAYRTDVDGRTPFHTFPNDAIRMLVQWHQSDIDITSQDYRGMTVMHYLSRSSSTNPWDIAWCLKHALPPKDALGRSILHLAAQRGNVPLLQYILSLPGASDIGTPDYQGRSLLHYATESRRVDTINVLLSAGYDINSKNYKGQNIMHHATDRGNTNAIERIIELGAEHLLDVQDQYGSTPRQVAAPYVKDLQRLMGVGTVIEQGKEIAVQKRLSEYFCFLLSRRGVVFILILIWLLRLLLRLR